MSCFANSQLSSNGVCITCQAPCLTCSSTNNNLCLSCPKGYLLQNSNCLFNQCPLYCSTCTNTSYCSQCISGYVSANGICTPCLQGCSQCSITSPSVCISCLMGTYLDLTSNTCIGCPLNCQTCTQNGCTTCLDGFYMTNSLGCAPSCNIPCATCSDSDPNSCLSCIFGYVFDPTAAQNCRPDLSCNYSLSCSGCPLGTVLSGTQCLPCDQNCARCSSSNQMLCTSCLPNQFLNASSRCQNCPTGCSSCLSKTICLVCASGYTSIVDVSGDSPTQCTLCSPPCLTCQGSAFNCLTCLTNYTLQNGNCISNFNFGFTVKLSVTAKIFYQNYIPFLTALSANVESNYGAVSVTSIRNGSIIVNGQISTTQSPLTSGSQSQYQGLLNTLNAQSTISGMTVVESSINTNGGSPTPV